jgi:hypothetical protein
MIIKIYDGRVAEIHIDLAEEIPDAMAHVDRAGRYLSKNHQVKAGHGRTGNQRRPASVKEN